MVSNATLLAQNDAVLAEIVLDAKDPARSVS
jgi:hypothetical protein